MLPAVGPMAIPVKRRPRARENVCDLGKEAQLETRLSTRVAYLVAGLVVSAT